MRNTRIVDNFNELATAIIILHVQLLTSTTKLELLVSMTKTTCNDKKKKDDKGYDDKITTA